MDAFRQDISTMSTALVFKREIPRWHLEICLGEFLIEFSVVGKIVAKNIFVLSFQHRSMGFTFNSYILKTPTGLLKILELVRHY